MQTATTVVVGQAREKVEAAHITAHAPALAVMLLGAAMLFVVGFLNVPSMHNATHDSRHAAGFPCH